MLLIKLAARSLGLLRRIRCPGALGEGSGLDLRLRPAVLAAAAQAETEMVSGNMGIWASGDLEIQKQGGRDMARTRRHADI